MRRLALAACAASLILGTAWQSEAADYKIDPHHTHVLFFVEHLGFSKMVGLFTEISGVVGFDPANIANSKLVVAIGTNSLQTQYAPRDKDLKGADWFDVAEFPEMKFVGTSFNKTGEKTGTIAGNLTLIGKTRPVTLDVVFNKMGVRQTDKVQAVGFSAVGKFKRSDFGMKTFIPYIGDEVDIVIETEAIQ